MRTIYLSMKIDDSLNVGLSLSLNGEKGFEVEKDAGEDVAWQKLTYEEKQKNSRCFVSLC